MRTRVCEEGGRRRGAYVSGLRLGFPVAEDLSCQDWVGESAARLLPILDAAIRERCERFTPLLVFLGGSAIDGELCGIEEANGSRSVLSDLDVGVVTAIRIPLEDQERIAAALEAPAGVGPAAKPGFYYLNDLGRQVPTLGMVETARNGYVLSGDSGLLDRFRMPEPSRIPTWEARRLLANRLIEWTAGCVPETGAAERVYAAAKLQADLAAVRLIASKGYRGGGYRARASAFGSTPSSAIDRERIESWTRWRVSPRWDETPLGMDVGAAAVAERLSLEVEEGVRAALRSSCGSDSAVRFLSPPALGLKTWARAWKRWRHWSSIGLRRITPRDLRRTPRILLWEATIELVLGRTDRSRRILTRLTADSAGTGEEVQKSLLRLAATMNREGVD